HVTAIGRPSRGSQAAREVARSVRIADSFILTRLRQKTDSTVRQILRPKLQAWPRCFLGTLTRREVDRHNLRSRAGGESKDTCIPRTLHWDFVEHDLFSIGRPLRGT